MTTTEDGLTPLGNRSSARGGDGRQKKVPNPVKDLGFCFLCGALVKKLTGWTLRASGGSSRLICEGCA